MYMYCYAMPHPQTLSDSSDLFIECLVLSSPADGLRGKVARGALLTFDPTWVGKSRNAIVSKFGVDWFSRVQGPDEDVV